MLYVLFNILRNTRIAVSLAGILCLLTAFLPAGWKPGHSTVTFKIKHAGLVVNGSLSGLQAEIRFDPADLSASNLTASLETASIDTGIALRNRHLRRADYLDAAKYPRLTMRSVRIEKTGNTAYTGYFNLTIKATTRPVQVPFTFTENGNSGVFKADFKINRLDYGVGEANWLMDDEVAISIQLTVTR